MKKTLFFASLLLAGFAMTSCSESDITTGGTQGEGTGDNYIAIGINLPTDPATTSRAGDDNNNAVTYDDGLASEYEVKTAAVLIWSSNQNTFRGAYTIFDATKPWSKNSTNQNVTEYSKKVVQEVDATVAKNDLLLVVLNYAGVMTISNDHKLTINSKTYAVGDTELTFTAFKALTASTTGLNSTTAFDSETNGFFMSNALLANKQGSTTTSPDGVAVRTLVPVTKVYKSEAEAQAATPDQIYVERGVAKVTLAQAAGTHYFPSSSIDGTGFTDSNDNGVVDEGEATDNVQISWTVTNWTLDNTNKTSYFVRSDANFTTATTGYAFLHWNKASDAVYRSIGNTALAFPSAAAVGDYKYRTYFSESANYAEASKGTKATNLNRIATSPVWQTLDKPAYCFENTMPVYNGDTIFMTKNNTTLIQLEVTTKVKGTTDPVDLYIIGGNKELVYTAEKIKTFIKARAVDLLNLKNYVADGSTIGTDDLDAVTLGTTAGTVTVSEISIKSGSETKLKEDAKESSKLKSEVVTALNTALGTITLYKGGKSYYHVLVKHFGDELTPWNTSETNKPTNSVPYYKDDAANNYLGRYGVLRNNWYSVSINSIRSLGDATPTTGTWPSTPDDNLDSYISFQINVLSWAKRTQSVDL